MSLPSTMSTTIGFRNCDFIAKGKYEGAINWYCPECCEQHAKDKTILTKMHNGKKIIHTANTINKGNTTL